MLTGKKIKKQALMWVKEGQAPLWGGGFAEGATWANEQNAAELAALRAENAKLIEVSKMVLSADYESTGGLLDCKDNNGQCYQSAFLAAALSKMQMIVCQIAEAKTDNL